MYIITHHPSPITHHTGNGKSYQSYVYFRLQHPVFFFDSISRIPQGKRSRWKQSSSSQASIDERHIVSPNCHKNHLRLQLQQSRRHILALRCRRCQLCQRRRKRLPRNQFLLHIVLRSVVIRHDGHDGVVDDVSISYVRSRMLSSYQKQSSREMTGELKDERKEERKQNLTVVSALHHNTEDHQSPRPPKAPDRNPECQSRHCSCAP